MTPPPRRTALLCALAAGAAGLDFGACPDSVPSPPVPERVECGSVGVPTPPALLVASAHDPVTVAAYLLDGRVPERDVRCVGPGLPQV